MREHNEAFSCNLMLRYVIRTTITKMFELKKNLKKYICYGHAAEIQIIATKSFTYINLR